MFCGGVPILTEAEKSEFSWLWERIKVAGTETVRSPLEVAAASIIKLSK